MHSRVPLPILFFSKIFRVSCTIMLALLMATNTLYAQSDSTQQKIVQSFNSISSKSLSTLNNKYNFLDKLLQRRTEKMLQRMQKKDASLQQQMQGKDSLKAKQLFANSQLAYQQFTAKLQGAPVSNLTSSYKEYIPGIDSMQTALKFLNHGNNIPGIPANKLQQVQALSQQLQQLQGRVQLANEAQDFVRQREQLLKDQLMQYGMGKQLLGMNKEVYYYQQQLAEYKSMLNDKEKMQQAVLGAVRQLPAFQTFWQKYSILAQLFPMPANFGTTQSLNGLQTMAATQSDLQRAGASIGPNAGSAYVQQQVQQAQSKLNQLKDKVSGLGGTGGSGDMTMPDFKPNGQHTKSFLKRLEYGFNIQNAQGTSLLPVTSTIALTLGYKLSDKATAGVGASYLMGWGNGLNHINITNQGAGLRSFIDIKAKGSIWISSGLEYTYYQQFSKITDIKNLDVWQKSALIGLTKKTAIGKKTANIQMLYDVLYNQQLPRGQMFKFRIGYTL